MKYLRKYNESYINIEDIKDICLELTDLGIVISISSTDAYRNKNVIYFHNYNIHNGMKWNDVKDCLLRLKDYLGDKFIEFGYSSVTNLYYNHITELNEYTYIKEPINSMFLRYIDI